MGRTRRHHSADQKSAALKRHHLEKVPVSGVCEELKLQPSQFYLWQKQLFENADKALGGAKVESASSARERQLEAKVATLEARIARKDQVIAEISEEHVKLKKELGEL
jgi:transposase-like protein